MEHNTTNATAQWLFDAMEKGKHEFASYVVIMTPEVAALLLERNEGNRTMNYRNLTQLKADINAGSWAFNGEPIIAALCSKRTKGNAVAIDGDTSARVCNAAPVTE